MFLQPSNLLEVLLVLQQSFLKFLEHSSHFLISLPQKCVLFLISGTESNEANHVNKITKKQV